jgi:hypothetical protein
MSRQNREKTRGVQRKIKVIIETLLLVGTKALFLLKLDRADKSCENLSDIVTKGAL